VNYQYYLKSTCFYSLLGTISVLFLAEKRSLTKLTFVLRISTHSVQISAP